MRDIQLVLQKWGTWAHEGNSDVDYSSIAAGFKGLLPSTKKREKAAVMMMVLRLMPPLID